MPPRRRGRQNNRDHDQPAPSLDDALSFLSSDAPIHSRDRRHCVACLVSLENHSRQRGLSPQVIGNLIDVVVSRKGFNFTNRKRLLYCLLPSETVPKEAVLCVVSSIGLNNCNSTLKVLLLKWLLCIWDAIDSEGKDALRAVYEMLFCHIGIDYLSPYVCHVLFLLTEAEDVTHFRIRHLMDLQSKVGPQPHLAGLLSLYCTFRPDLIFINFGKKKFFRSLGKLQTLYNNMQQNVAPSHPSATEAKLGLKQDRAKVIKLLTSPTENGFTYDNIFDVLDSPFRRIFISSCRDQSFFIRLEFWLRVEVFDQLYEFKPSKDVSKLFHKLLSLSEELQGGIFEVKNFLCDFLQTWDPSNYTSDVLGLISWFPICPFAELYNDVLKLLKNLVYSSSLEFQCKILHCLTQLLKNWATIEYARGKEKASLNGGSRLPEHNHFMGLGTPEDPLSVKDLRDAIDSLADYINNFCTLLVFLNRDRPSLLLHHILDFYNVILDVNSTELVLLHLPSYSVLNACLLTFNVLVLARFCSLMTRYHHHAHHLKRTMPTKKLNVLISQLNKYFRDMVSLLCSHQYDSSELTLPMINKILPEEDRNFVYQPQFLFNLCLHPALLSCVLKVDFGSLDLSLPVEELCNMEELQEMVKEQLVQANFQGISEFLNIIYERPSRRSNSARFS